MNIAPHSLVPAVGTGLTIDSTVFATEPGVQIPAGRGPISAVIVLVGRFDAVEAPAVRTELTRTLDAGATCLVVDLSAVTFVDSAGLAALVKARRDAQRAGGELVLISPSNRDALRVFRLTQFDEVFRMVDRREPR